MKKLLVWIFICLLFTGCTGQVKKIEIKENVEVQFFSVKDCGECGAFKKKAIPYLENTFGDKVKITMYDLDDKEDIEVYEKVYKSLKDFDEEYYGYGPLINIPDHFAILGYEGGYEKYIAQDILSDLNGTSLSEDLSKVRYYHKVTSKES